MTEVYASRDLYDKLSITKPLTKYELYNQYGVTDYPCRVIADKLYRLEPEHWLEEIDAKVFYDETENKIFIQGMHIANEEISWGSFTELPGGFAPNRKPGEEYDTNILVSTSKDIIIAYNKTTYEPHKIVCMIDPTGETQYYDITDVTHINKSQFIDRLGVSTDSKYQPLTLTSIGEDPATITFSNATNSSAHDIYILNSDNEWERYNEQSITLKPGESVYFKGILNNNEYDYAHFTGSGGAISASGNLNIIYANSDSSSWGGTLAFYRLFEDCANLVSVSEDLLQSRSGFGLTTSCFAQMFKNCTSLEGVYLPETSLQDGSYISIFEGCQSLRTIHCHATDWFTDFDDDSRPFKDWLSRINFTEDDPLHLYIDRYDIFNEYLGDIPEQCVLHYEEPFCITNDDGMAGRDVTIQFKRYGYNSQYIDFAAEYSKGDWNDESSWVPFTEHEEPSDKASATSMKLSNTITLHYGEHVYLRCGESAAAFIFTGNSHLFSRSKLLVHGGLARCHGNIGSLRFGKQVPYMTYDYKTHRDLSLSYTAWAFSELFNDTENTLKTAPDLWFNNYPMNSFSSSFENCTHIVSAPRIIYGETDGPSFMYAFKNCTSLSNTPTIIVNKLTNQCFYATFEGCQSLTHTSNIIVKQSHDSTASEFNCCLSMFRDCTSLTTAGLLDIKDLTGLPHCCEHMFKNCYNLTKAPDLPATTLSEYCYSEMFYGCHSLAKAPDLPATTLSEYCYSKMFYDCYSLAIAPELPAKALTDYCYDRMFSGCSSLHTVICNAESTAINSIRNWLYSICPKGRFYANPSMEWTLNSASGIPQDWERIDIRTLIVTCYLDSQWEPLNLRVDHDITELTSDINSYHLNAILNSNGRVVLLSNSYSDVNHTDNTIYTMRITPSTPKRLVNLLVMSSSESGYDKVYIKSDVDDTLYGPYSGYMNTYINCKVFNSSSDYDSIQIKYAKDANTYRYADCGYLAVPNDSEIDYYPSTLDEAELPSDYNYVNSNDSRVIYPKDNPSTSSFNYDTSIAYYLTDIEATDESGNKLSKDYLLSHCCIVNYAGYPHLYNAGDITVYPTKLSVQSFTRLV